ncbi:hypothetical protein [Pseudoduganella namucuonensis]|uniref:Uncharacterized protein n=1 Tax=Pseudoduganella namucuonensis TaxID=1035707 RepID=A0A1I7K009_9BURK|nr:hypothetical protein [Pseudoduganella namucuonensis]SFU90742.1 hypothetical protein SAMN05216552_101430 [Pseudoduganella namucuonensis]
MAKGLSFLFEARGTSAQNLVQGLSQGTGNGPDILHYLWLVEIPAPVYKDDHKTYLLTTVYDENFEAYIGDLVKADFEKTGGKFFDAAAQGIEGLQAMVPVHKHLSEFINFVAQHDLTQTNPAGPFTQFYPWTAALIHSKLGPHQPSDKQ